MDSVELLREAIRLHGEGTPFCTVTVANARGSVPQEIGAKAIVGGDGLICGTIGGGRVEAHGLAKARELLKDGANARVVLETVNLNRDLGMTCGGEMTLFYEVYRPEHAWRVFIFGAGHISQRLCRLLIELDCRVVCFDTRAEWIERLPQSGKLERRLVDAFPDGVDAVPPGAFVLVITMGHATDVPVLEALSRRGVETAFLGAVGSDAKAATLRRELRERALPQDFIDHVTCPLGEKIGGNTPADIAVSALAQLVRVRGDLSR
ncbi:MAG: XdhC family protein [Xanthobacteraceae bacterium]